MGVIFKCIENILNNIRDFLKNTRGVRILKCIVDENQKKIVVFQALGSFHAEEMEYEEYKIGLIFDTEPCDVELVSFFFIALILNMTKPIILI